MSEAVDRMIVTNFIRDLTDKSTHIIDFPDAIHCLYIIYQNELPRFFDKIDKWKDKQIKAYERIMVEANILRPPAPFLMPIAAMVVDHLKSVEPLADEFGEWPPLGDSVELEKAREILKNSTIMTAAQEDSLKAALDEGPERSRKPIPSVITEAQEQHLKSVLEGGDEGGG